jgi:hypothetical protein
MKIALRRRLDPADPGIEQINGDNGDLLGFLKFRNPTDEELQRGGCNLRGFGVYSRSGRPITAVQTRGEAVNYWHLNAIVSLGDNSMDGELDRPGRLAINETNA